MKINNVVALCILLLGPALCQAVDDKPSISVKAELDKAFITIGDPVQYTVTIKRSPTVQLLSAIPAPPEDIFKIKKIDEFKQEQEGTLIEGRKMTLTTFRLGEFILAPIKMEYRIGDNPPQTIETSRIYLTVQSVAAGEEKMDIRGIKSVLSIAQNFFQPVVIMIAALLLAGLAIFLISRMRRNPLAALTQERVLTPEEEALLHLSRLFDSDLLRKGKVKDYYLRLSEVLRVYFEKRFGILAVELTTFETMLVLAQKEINPALLEKINEVLQAADLAKFAKWKPEPKEILEINRKSKEIVEEAAPKEVPGGV